MVLRETQSVTLTMWSERKLIHGPNLCLVQPCWYSWERFEMLELFVNQYALIENALDPEKNRYVLKSAIELNGRNNYSQEIYGFAFFA